MRHQHPETLDQIVGRWFDSSAAILPKWIDADHLPPNHQIESAWMVGDSDRWLVMSQWAEGRSRGGHLFFLVDRAGGAGYRDLTLARLFQIISRSDAAVAEMAKHSGAMGRGSVRVVTPVDHPSVEIDGPNTSIGRLMVALPGEGGEVSLGFVSGRRTPWRGGLSEKRLEQSASAVVNLVLGVADPESAGAD